jgi:L-lysine 2,3-aminomutase
MHPRIISQGAAVSCLCRSACSCTPLLRLRPQQARLRLCRTGAAHRPAIRSGTDLATKVLPVGPARSVCRENDSLNEGIIAHPQPVERCVSRYFTHVLLRSVKFCPGICTRSTMMGRHSAQLFSCDTTARKRDSSTTSLPK